MRILRAVALVAGCSMFFGCVSPQIEPAEESAASEPVETQIQRIDPPAGPGAMAPDLTQVGENIVLTWLEPEDPEKKETYSLRIAKLVEESWEEPVTIHRGEDLFVNWADIPSVAQIEEGQRVAHWLGKLGEDTYAYGVHLATSAGDSSWAESGLLHDDASPTEHGFVSWVPSPNGLHAFWLDGREMADGGPMTLRATRLTSDGPQSSQLLDDRVCECCSTDAAWTSEGAIVVYRDRDADEVRNIGVVRATEEGWSEPTTLHDDGWRINGCPVNGPAIDALDKHVAVAWFTVDDNQSRVQIAFSKDAGASFAEPVVIDTANPLGRVDLALDDLGSAHVLWLARQGEAAEIRLQQISPKGELGPAQTITSTTQSRSAGVPRLAKDGDRLLVVWVEDTKPSQVRVVAVR